MIRFGKYGIEADSKCYTLGIPSIVIDKKTGEERETLLQTTFHATVRQALVTALRKEQRALVSEKDMSLTEAIVAFEKLQKEFLLHLKIVKERVGDEP